MFVSLNAKEEVREAIGADRLIYQDLGDLIEARGELVRRTRSLAWRRSVRS